MLRSLVGSEMCIRDRHQLVDGPDHKIRNILLEILNRLPSQSPSQNEALRPYALDLMRLAMGLLESDNEPNAVICLRIIFELHKNYRPQLQNEVQPFLDFVQKIYRDLKPNVDRILGPQTQQQQHAPQQAAVATPQGFGTPAAVSQQQVQQAQPQAGVAAFSPAPTPHSPAVTPIGAPVPSSSPQPLIRSIESFKVLTECPLIVTLLFQLYPRFVVPNMAQLTPVMVQALSLQPPAHAAKQHKDRFADFMAAQVKTLYYITYHLRSFTEIMTPYRDSITVSVIQLLMNCPSESVSMRRELLVATRHILQTDLSLIHI
eukprot:TRINITY_DN20235_c0_g1_i3.p1 TRINITY_DN20235_c0_g1~~TRINITY_DN20235_c0_g1_i3.p1  ORF type:complete len:338 (+),score=86.97 TRINITY_DN20235_c0_g1_i3:64-1014(+)